VVHSAAMGGPVSFEDVLAPVTTKVFMEEHWEKRSLFIPGDPAKLARLLQFEKGDLYRSLASGPQDLAATKGQYFDEAGLHREIKLPVGNGALAPALVDAGMTLCVPSMPDRSVAVKSVASAIVGAFRWSDGEPNASAYVSRDGGGFGLHFDVEPVLVVQCEGRKRWRYGQTPGAPVPRVNAVADHIARFARRDPGVRVHVPDEASLCECVLSPGDVLFLPGGTWHRTYAEGFSLGLTFDFGYNPFLGLITKALEESELAGTIGWRTAVPEGDPDAFIEARLAELREFVAKLDARTLRSGPLRAAAASLFQEHTSREDATGRERPRGSKARVVVEPGDRLKVLPRHRLAFYTKSASGEELLGCATSDDDVFEIPLTLAPLLDRIIDAGDLVAADVAGWDVVGAGDWDRLRGLLEALCATGAARVVR